MIGVVALVADQPSAGRGVVQKQCRRPGGDRPAASISAWILVVRPLREQPMAWPRSPPFAPLVARCARTAVLSIIATTGGSAQPASAAKISCHSRRWLHRLYRLNTVVYGPYSAGKARQRQPSRRRRKMPLMIRRSSRHTGPVCTIGRCRAITTHCHRSAKNYPA